MIARTKSPIMYKNRPLTASRIIDLVRKAAIFTTPTKSVKTFYGPRMMKRRGDLTFIASALGHYGSFISDKLHAIDGPFVFLDIGANAGLYSLLAAARPECDQVIAIEPVPSTFSVLVQNIAINEAAKVTPICGAVSTSDAGFVAMSFDPKHSGVSHVVEKTRDRVDHEVLAFVVSPMHLGLLLGKSTERIVIKIDVEGSEADVLTTIERAGLFPRITDAIIELSTLNDSSVQNVLSARSIMSRNGFIEETAIPATATFHYDAYFVRSAAQQPD
ncbi:FkbM family methyltransferase [Mesorhizobium sp. M1403]|uniref:FkbM family methyltransferase n=1 Tax=Mesorhizobium sp. M1403 TaxID=2957097 RepID=UPI00333A703E